MLFKTMVLAGLLTAAALAAGPYDKPTDQKPAEVLPAAIVNGTNSQVLAPVEDDGYLYVYRVKSKFPELKVVSTATLMERSHEFDAIAQLDKLKGSQQFADGIKKGLGKVVDGGENLVTDPVGTMTKTFNGVGRLFSNIGTAITGGGQSGGDSMISEASGFSAVKRQYAKQFAVDPYSRNPYLQQTLSDVSKAGFLGGAITSLGLGAVGGAAGALISVTTMTKGLSDLVSQPPQTVADYCSDKLSGMGVSDDTSDLFLKNDNFTITERTAIVMSLDTMSSTQNRQNFIKLAVLTHDNDVASFRRRQAELYAAYHQKIQPVQQFNFTGQFATATLADGTTLVIAPVDRLLWTQDISTYASGAGQGVTGKKQLWLSGTASPLAMQNLTSAGWAVTQKAVDRLK